MGAARIQVDSGAAGQALRRAFSLPPLNLKPDRAAMTKPTVFIDGEAGTTGLQIRDRLAALTDVQIISIDAAERKSADARRAMMAKAGVVILCLPDEAAKDAVALAATLGKDQPRIIDASSAHRVASGWTYGFPELTSTQSAAIRAATHVSNPGCYPTGAISLLRPLVDAGLIPKDHPITVNAVSGYSGGGNAMIAAYEDTKTAPPFELYGLGLEHKHVPELEAYSGLTRRPIFVPSVGNFKQGMLVSIPLHLDTLPNKPSASDLEAALVRHYRGSAHVHVVPGAATATGGRIPPEALNDTDALELYVFANERLRQAVLVARLDNLGKGAAGAAVQNIKLMFQLLA
jgi:N-acetyl-gamma-glutamyl-phosphate reductase